ncbi:MULTISPECIES: hypothetical protein [unclassified Bacillus (in: firmicutes)]|uniref:hypothetical protein n=1 Tax=unclassified Bacillus (in: firmicutes) TaxID=185979 RepID=UPI001BE85AC3|nr:MULTISPECIES: hypothetical protein [unclassified Bacillus (in: firmicutes)]MBT2639304.1 hypothetical protein [Bacillus sp. ISL-39]MBT2660496.1 hypothetical protein [Bacillus sp. ISL-45]
MLTFEQKLAIIESFSELERKNVSLGRVNFHFADSIYEKKNVVYHLHPNGNGFVYGEFLEGYEADAKGMVNIRDFTEEELKSIIKKSIESLSGNSTVEAAIIEDNEEERWINSENHTLIVVHEDDMWNVYAGLNLDGTFLSYNEAKQYLEEEGFRKR